MSLEPVLAGFGITSAVEKALGFPAAAARSKMTFAVGRISKCTLKLKLLVFLFCSPEVGLSYHVKCADRSAPSPNLRVSENRPIVLLKTRVQTLLINLKSFSALCMKIYGVRLKSRECVIFKVVKLCR